MNLGTLKYGDIFGLVEFGETTPFIAEEDARIVQKDGNDYYEVMARNLVSDITIPLAVHVGYPHYLRICPILSDKPIINMVWSDERMKEDKK